MTRLIIFLLALAALAGIYLLIKQLAKAPASHKSATSKTAEQDTQEIQPVVDLLDFDAIDEDGIIYTQGGGVRAILSVTPVNYDLLSDEEQNNIEAVWTATLAACASWPISMVLGTQPLNIRRNIDALRQSAAQNAINGSEALRQQFDNYAAHLAAYLDNWMRSREIRTKFAYIVVPVDGEPTRERALTELDRRCRTIAASLSRVDMPVRIMGYNEVVQLIYNILHGTSGVGSLDNVLAQDMFAPVVTGITQGTIQPAQG